MACGGYHTWVLTTDGTLFSCGWNEDGQLGRRTGGTASARTLARVDPPLPARVDPPLPDGFKAAQVACGNLHTWVLTTDGALFSCGRNRDGQLGVTQGGIHYTKVSPWRVSTCRIYIYMLLRRCKWFVVPRTAYLCKSSANGAIQGANGAHRYLLLVALQQMVATAHLW